MKWEYKILTFSFNEKVGPYNIEWLVDDLNRSGADGWEAIEAWRQPNSFRSADELLVILKRPVDASKKEAAN